MRKAARCHRDGRDAAGIRGHGQLKNGRCKMHTAYSRFASAVAAMVALGAVDIASAQQAPKPEPVPTYKAEKCYGIVKSGKNDCQTATSSCAGTSRRDGQKDAWVYVPAGVCAKIVGGASSAKG
jgi:uncharacterized membrane protein